MHSILLVEDDTDLAELLSRFLERKGFDVTVDHGPGALEKLVRIKPDICVLDVELPGTTGFAICARARAQGFEGPILFVTARQSVTDEMSALELGGDDFIRKPFDPHVLALRIETIMRRMKSDGETWEHGGLRIERGPRRVYVHGELVTLSSGLFDLLWLLATHANEIVTRERYFEEIRGIRYDGTNRSFDSRVRDLRNLLTDAGLSRDRIVTVRGEGYQLALV